MIWMVKLLHLAAISIWSGGLVVVPFLLCQRHNLTGEPLHRLHRLTRTLYITILSPAAFVAIASGTALIFLQATFVEWFSVKLVLVGMLAALHVQAGLLILQVFDSDGQITRGGAVFLTVGVIATVVAVLGIVLWKPHIDALTLAPELFQPGRLSEIMVAATSWVRP